MKNTVKYMLRLLWITCIGISLLAGTAMSVFAAENMQGDDSISGLSGDSAIEDLADSPAGTENGDTSSDRSTGKSNPLLPVEDLSGELASLKVHLVYVDEEIKDSVPVTGAVIDLFKVADLVTENGAAHYNLTDAFTSSGIDFEGMTASESLDAAEKLNALINEKSIQPIANVTTNEQGDALFTDLDPGMYLGRQRDLVQISKTKKITMEPVLWMTPMYMPNDTQDAYVWNYSPEVYPKEGEIQKIPTATPTPTPKPTSTPASTATPKITPRVTLTPVPMQPGRTPDTPSKQTTTSGTKLVKTGDTSPIALYVAVGAAAIAIIVLLIRKK